MTDPEKLKWARGILIEKLEITDDIFAFNYLVELAEKGLTNDELRRYKE